MFAIVLTIIALAVIVLLSVLLVYESIGMTAFVIVGTLTIIVYFIFIVKRSDRLLADKQSDVWDTIDSHLATQGFYSTSKIEVCGTVQSTKKDVKLPSLVISVDMNAKKFAFTKYDTGHLSTNFLEFGKITGGEILIGGKSTTTISSGMGGVRYGVTAGLGTSNSSNFVHSMEYRFTINDVLNPFYTIVIFDRDVCESAPIYRHYFEVASKLDVLVKSIVGKSEN